MKTSHSKMTRQQSIHQKPHIKDSTSEISMWDSGSSNQNLRALLKWMKRHHSIFKKKHKLLLFIDHLKSKILFKSNCLIYLNS